MTAEAPGWQPDVQRTIPKFGTTQPIVLDDLTPHLFSISGRPINANASHPPHVPIRYAPGRSDGNRAKTKAEYASYGEVKHYWADTLGFVSFLRDELYPDTPDLPPSASRYIAKLIPYISHWLVYRSDEPIENGKLPPFLTGAAKVMQGMNDAFDVRYEGTTGPTGHVIPVPTDDQLTRTDPFVTFVMENDLLISRKRPGESCPATESDLKDIVTALFKGSSEDSKRGKEIAKAVGITSENIGRIRQFGDAIMQAITITNVLVEAITELPGLRDALREGKQVRFKPSEDAELVDFADLYVNTINSAHENMNQALRREQLIPFTKEEFRRAM